MALKIAQEENFKTIRTILANPTIDDATIVKKGLKLAAKELNIGLETDS